MSILPAIVNASARDCDYNRAAIAFANDSVLPSPPRSGVSESLASSVAMIALRRRSAC